ncbi:unnamed protein product [Paramecium pentaurelia]|uniref:Uncharacterized protein n=1 Tax=Paramecium pentaurelia TaxID=43138 RepID=A0A8S1VGT6_9CILI|nr:unnamed protein product [Paramecium pentaurelia]
MSCQKYEFDQQLKIFKICSLKENSIDRLEEYFQAYQKLQNQVSLKLPMGQYFRLAKISSIKKQGMELHITFYYEGLYGNQTEVIWGLQQFSKALPFSETFPDKQKIDVIGIKQVFQSLIETFHWCANFGMFLDPTIDHLLYKEGETDFYVLIPSFTYIAQFLSDQKTLQIKDLDVFRSKTYQNLTFIFLLRLLDEFFGLIKQQDEDINLYKRIKEKYTFPQGLKEIDPYLINESCYGADFIYSEDLAKKKMIRYGLKQSQFLYQLNENEILRGKLQKFLDLEQVLLGQANDDTKVSQQLQNAKKEKILNKSGTEDKTEKLTLTQNVVNFFSELKSYKPLQGISQDIYTSFLRALTKQENGIKIRRNWKLINTKHELELIIVQKSQEQGQQQVRQKEQQAKSATNSQSQDQNINSEQFEIKWASWINPQNLIFMSITQSGVLTDKDLKKFTIQYKIEMLEDKNCYLIKTCVPEIIFGIDSADDIAYFVNSIQKERMPTNVYVDDTRKLTFYTALVQGNKGNILWEIVKIMDIHQIYFYHSLDFYAKNINPGKQIKDAKYSSFLVELKNLIQDYEYDSKQIYTQIQEKQSKGGF